MNKTDKNWLSPCGIDCSRCSIYLRTEEELEYWKKQGVDINTIRCHGCRSDRTGIHWSPDCKILQCCVYDKELTFCTECMDFPCNVLKEWEKEAEHHKKALSTLHEMKKTGIEKWCNNHGYE